MIIKFSKIAGGGGGVCVIMNICIFPVSIALYILFVLFVMSVLMLLRKEKTKGLYIACDITWAHVERREGPKGIGTATSSQSHR